MTKIRVRDHLKSSANAPTSLVGGGEKLSTEPLIFKGIRTINKIIN